MNTNFQLEPQLRAVVMFAVIGYLGSKWADMPQELGAALGAVAGSLFDLALFHIKKAWPKKKEEEN